MEQSENIIKIQSNELDRPKKFSTYLLIKLNSLFVSLILNLFFYTVVPIFLALLWGNILFNDLLGGILSVIVTFLFARLYGKKNWRNYCGICLDNFLTVSLLSVLPEQGSLIIGRSLLNILQNSDSLNRVLIFASLILYQVFRDLEKYFRFKDSKIASTKWNIFFIFQVLFLILLTLTNSNIWVTEGYYANLLNPLTLRNFFEILSKFFPLCLVLFYTLLPHKDVVIDTIGDLHPKKNPSIIKRYCAFILPLLLLAAIIYAKFAIFFWRG